MFTELTITIRIPKPGAPVCLPPVARSVLPQASGEEAADFNHVRKYTALALHLIRQGASATCSDSLIDRSAHELGWSSTSARGRNATVRAILHTLLADPYVETR